MRTCVIVGSSIKQMWYKGKGLTFFGSFMLPKFCGLCFTCESLDTKLVERVEALHCKAILEFIGCWFLVCGPFAAQGAMGEEEYP
jgi:hypothetical protein